MKFSLATILFQILMIILFAKLVRYDPEQSGPVKKDKNMEKSGNISYPLFQDVHVMIFVGFGFLMTFLKKYGYSSVGYNLFISALAIQWYTIIAGCIEHRGTTDFTIELNIEKLITADFAAASVLITFGVVLGKVSRLQLFVICIFEIVMFSVNEFILIKKLKISDVGGSLVIHCFGCYFGLALSFMLRTTDANDHPKESAVYHSDLFAMIGTLFLWMYWPSFNSALVTVENDQQRAIINTYLSLVACCVTTFAISGLVNKQRKLSMVHVQNATLAGGVAIGTVANMIIEPWGAILIGSLAGVISVLGYTYVTPFLNRKLQLHDTCGVNNLHGMPALLAGTAGIIASRLADENHYQGSFKTVFEAERSSKEQAVYQLLAIVVTLAISITSGLSTGFIVKQKLFDSPTRDQLFDDKSHWEIEAQSTSHAVDQTKLAPVEMELLPSIPEENV